MPMLNHPTRWPTAACIIASACCVVATPATRATEAPSGTHTAHPDQHLKGHRFQQIHMGMPVHLVLYAESTEKAQVAGKAAYARVAELDRILSDWRPDSELNRATEQAFLAPVPVSPDLFFVLEKAIDLARRTEGAFDLTAGPIIQLWREARQTGQPPAPLSLAEARALTGFQHIRLNPEQQTLRLTLPNLQLDLGGIAKGYIADEVKKTLAQHKIDCFLFTAGGDILAGTAPPPLAPPEEGNGVDQPARPRGWRIDPAKHADTAGTDQPVPILYLENEAASISGDTVQFVVIDGLRYSHVVDPRTGQALTDRRMCVVRGKHAVDTDGLATAGTIMDPADFQPLLKQYEAEGWVFQASDQVKK